jgi:hypothetical protein
MRSHAIFSSADCHSAGLLGCRKGIDHLPFSDFLGFASNQSKLIVRIRGKPLSLIVSFVDDALPATIGQPNLLRSKRSEIPTSADRRHTLGAMNAWIFKVI